MKIKNQKGFSLVEIAIVFGLLGLFMLGVVKGQEWYMNVKIYKLQSEFKKYESMIGMYFMKTGTYPASGFTGVSFTGNEFNELFWKDLRAADLVKGEATDGSSPVSALGDIDHNFWVAQGGGRATSLFRHALYLCTTGVKGLYAKTIDLKLDDGKGTTGNIKSLKYSGDGIYTRGLWRKNRLLDYTNDDMEMVMCKVMQRRHNLE